MLDPACGSMHFGLYAFDLFERIYDEAWDQEADRGADAFVRPEGLKPLHDTYDNKDAFLRDVPRLIIERNIHGIDIDPRAVQIAGLSLWLRAQNSWQAQGVASGSRPQIQRSNIVCAEPMPGEADMLSAFIQTLDTPLLGDMLKAVFDQMQLAGEAGFLLRVEDEVRETIAKARQAAQVERDNLFAHESANDETFFETAEIRIHEALRAYSENADANVYQRRLFAHDTADGFAFIDICRLRYDVILMNPPFGAWTATLKPQVKKRFPSSYNDILHAFVECGLRSLTHGGRLGAISARTGFFLGDSKKWRRDIVFRHRLACFADLGLSLSVVVPRSAAGMFAMRLAS